jgi:hypothetical protein
VGLRSIQVVCTLAQPRLFARASIDRGVRSSAPRRVRSPSAQYGPVMPADRGARGLTAGRAPAYTAGGLTRGWRGLRREAHLSAEQHRPQAPAWLSRAHGDGRRSAGAGAAPRQGAQAPVGLKRRPSARVGPWPTMARPRIGQRSGWCGSSVGQSFSRLPRHDAAGRARRSCCRWGRGGRRPVPTTPRPRSGWDSPPAGGSVRRSRAIAPAGAWSRRRVRSYRVRRSRETIMSSWHGRRF